MKILWVAKTQLDLAVDRSTWIAMVRELQRIGHAVILLTGTSGPRDSFGLGDALVYARTSRQPGLFHASFSVDVVRFLRRQLQCSRPDAVIFDPMSAPAVIAAAAGRGHAAWRPRLVLDVRTLASPSRSIPHRGRAALFQFGLMAARGRIDGATLITPAMRETLCRRGLLREDVPWICWSSGVDTALFDPAAVSRRRIAELRDDLGLTDRFVFLYHGVMELTRGLANLVQAFAIIPERLADRCALLLVGGGSGIADLQVAAARLSKERKVVIVPPVRHEQIPEIVACADAGVLPFPDLAIWRTSSPIKLFEYLAMGKPVVVTDIEAHRSVLESHPCAVWADGASPQALANALVRMSTMPSRQLRAAGEDGRDLVAGGFTWAAQSRKLSAFLEDLL